MPLRESKAKVLEQLILRLTFELSQDDDDFENDRARLATDDYEFELTVKQKMKLRLVSDDD